MTRTPICVSAGPSAQCKRSHAHLVRTTYQRNWRAICARSVAPDESEAAPRLVMYPRLRLHGALEILQWSATISSWHAVRNWLPSRSVSILIAWQLRRVHTRILWYPFQLFVYPSEGNTDSHPALLWDFVLSCLSTSVCIYKVGACRMLIRPWDRWSSKGTHVDAISHIPRSNFNAKRFQCNWITGLMIAKSRVHLSSTGFAWLWCILRNWWALISISTRNSESLSLCWNTILTPGVPWLTETEKITTISPVTHRNPCSASRELRVSSVLLGYWFYYGSRNKKRSGFILLCPENIRDAHLCFSERIDATPTDRLRGTTSLGYYFHLF